MKAFFDAWNAAFARTVAERLARQKGQEVAAEVAWTAAEELPRAEDALAVALRWTGQESGDLEAVTASWEGSVVLLASRTEIALLLEDVAPERVREAKTDAGEDPLAAQWTGWLQEVVAAMPLPSQPARIETSARPQGQTLAPYLLRVGKLAVRMAVACELSEKPMQHEPERKNKEAEPLLADMAASGFLGATHFPGTSNLDLLLDIEVDASLRFGAREISIRELLDTGPGDVLELDRHITDPVDLVVGDKIVARGEVVLVNGNFGLRVTEVAEPKKCLESVRCLF